jgi:hypothetical protein
VRAPGARAARLLRWYPRAWRSRYGEEFTELLVADIEERPRSRSRTADVIRGGIVARLGQAGLCGAGLRGDAPEPGAHQAGASLASLGCCAAVFAAVGGAMWSQLTIGWQWSAPAAAGVTVTGAAAVVRRAGRSPAVLSPAVLSPAVLSPAVLRFETWLARAACAAMATFLAGACAWMLARAPGAMFRPGLIDVAGLVVLALALAVAHQAAGQARVGVR